MQMEIAARMRNPQTGQQEQWDEHWLPGMMFRKLVLCQEPAMNMRLSSAEADAKERQELDC